MFDEHEARWIHGFDESEPSEAGARTALHEYETKGSSCLGNMKQMNHFVLLKLKPSESGGHVVSMNMKQRSALVS